MLIQFVEIEFFSTTEGSKKQKGAETLDLWMREGWVGVHRINKMDTRGLSERKTGNLKEVCTGWINRGRKDHGFGWGMR